MTQDAGSFMVQAQTPHAYVLRRALEAGTHRGHLAELCEPGIDSFLLKLPTAGLGDAVRGLEGCVAAYRS